MLFGLALLASLLLVVVALARLTDLPKDTRLAIVWGLCLAVYLPAAVHTLGSVGLEREERG